MQPNTVVNIDHSMPLSQRLRQMHEHLLGIVPALDRVACALYRAEADTLTTFIHSTRQGVALSGYEFKLSDSPSLLALARSGEFRVLDDIPRTLNGNSVHTQWLREQGFVSSFTVPIYGNGHLIGFVFFDSKQPHVFTPRLQRDLVLFCTLIGMEVSSQQAAVQSIVSTIKLARNITHMRDFETGAHLERMAHYSHLIARQVASVYGLSDEFVEQVYMYAMMHDVGKIGIPDDILLKRSGLTAEERLVMQTHVTKGEALIDNLIGACNLGDLTDTQILRNIVSCHHEYLDGSGYPRGLSGEQIPVEARIVAVADIFDAMTSLRPYKYAWSVADALKEVQHMADNGKLDGACVQVLHDHRDEVLGIMQRFQDAVDDAAAV